MLMDKIKYSITILESLVLLVIPIAKANLGDTSEEMNAKWGIGKEGKAKGTHDFKTITWKKEGVNLKAFFTFQNKCFKMVFSDCQTRTKALNLLKNNFSIDFKFQYSLKDDNFKGVPRNKSKLIDVVYSSKDKKLIIKDKGLLLKTQQIGKNIKENEINLPATPLLGNSLEEIENQFPGGEKIKNDEGLIKIHWGINNWNCFNVEALFTPISNICFWIEVRKGVKEFCISKEEALVISKILLPNTPLKIKNDKKNINYFKGEATLKNKAKRVDFRYTREFTHYWEDFMANLTLESRHLSKQKVHKLREISQGK